MKPHHLIVFALLAACGQAPVTDAGVITGDGGTFLPFTPPATQSVNNSLLVTISGEASALEGFGFPPAGAGGAPYFLDGWEVRFEQVLVTMGGVAVHENPELNPNDPSQVGALVAEVNGPWAVDLAKGGSLDAKEQNGKAVALARLTSKNTQSGSPAFDPTTRYAFSYSLVTAQQNVLNVNLDEAGETSYREMIEKGWSVLLVGTATWRGDTACRSTGTTYDFARFPQSVKFRFGFAAPVNFKNCVNPDLSPSDSRGVQTSTNAQTVAQLTLHLDHPFWESLEEDAPLRWDALSARKSVAMGAGPASAELTTADLAIDLFAPRDAQSAPIPWRTCGPVLPTERTSGTISYDPVNVPVNPAGGAAGLKDLTDYMTYNLSTFGHLNNDGLCFPERKYPSPR